MRGSLRCANFSTGFFRSLYKDFKLITVSNLGLTQGIQSLPSQTLEIKTL